MFTVTYYPGGGGGVEGGGGIRDIYWWGCALAHKKGGAPNHPLPRCGTAPKKGLGGKLFIFSRKLVLGGLKMGTTRKGGPPLRLRLPSAGVYVYNPKKGRHLGLIL